MKTSALKLVRSPVGEEQIAERPVPSVSPVKTVLRPANDGLSGLISGKAPDPSSEIPVEPEPVFEIPSGDEAVPRQFKKVRLASAVNDNTSRYLDMDGGSITVSNMEESDFIEFWAKDVWDTVSAVGSFPVFGLDLREIETGDDELEQGQKAAKHLYRLAHKYPKWLGWMISESTLDGGDVIMCAAFFGGKAMAVLAAFKEKKAERLERKNQKLVEAQDD